MLKLSKRPKDHKRVESLQEEGAILMWDINDKENVKYIKVYKIFCFQVMIYQLNQFILTDDDTRRYVIKEKGQKE